MYKKKCLPPLKTIVFQGFYSCPEHRQTHGMIWLGPIPPHKKIKRPHLGTQILSQILKGGKGNRGQMPHIHVHVQCMPRVPPLGLNIHQMQIWVMADHSVIARDELHESEVKESSMICFENASPENSCFVLDLFCCISLCVRVAVFLNATRRDRNLPPFTSKGK